jgi:LPS sulfotransferase NodH
MNKIKKFIVFGQSRSGSTLLVDLINLHPEIRCEGELLQYDWGYIPSKFMCKVLACYPYPFFNYRYRLSKGNTVYGFKLFVYHLKKSQKKIKKMTEDGWKIIYLKRENLLRQVVSNQIAKQTRTWHTKKGKGNPEYQVYLPISLLQQGLSNRQRWCFWEYQCLKDREYLKVVYEKELEDSSRHQETAEKVFRYLGVDPCQVHSEFCKTDLRPYEEIISNYDEVIQFLQDSPFKSFLDKNGRL